jgi:hypothetical protein
LLKISEIYSAEKEICKESIDTIDWKYDSVENSLVYLRCSKCLSSLIQVSNNECSYPDINLRCKSCNFDFNFSDVVEQCIDASLSVEAYMSIKDGGKSPYDVCFECNKSTFVYSEKCCVACGYEMEYIYCKRCEDTLNIDDQYNEGLCGYCQHIWNTQY